MNTNSTQQRLISPTANSLILVLKLFFMCLLLIVENTISAQAPEIEWSKSFGGTADDIARSIEKTPSGNYIIAGSAASADMDVTGHHGTTEYSDYWLLNTTADGTIIWQKSYGGSSNDVATDIHPTSDGGYIVSGYAESADGNVTDHIGFIDYWILKLNPLGTISWKKSLGGTIGESLQDIIETPDGGFIGIGNAHSADGDVSENFGGDDYWVVRLDASGNLLWEKSYGGSDDEYGWSILRSQEGGYLLGGYSRSEDGDIESNHGSFDVWLVKISDDGTIEWERSYGGSNTEYHTGIIQNSDGDYVVCNSTLSADNGNVSGNHYPNTTYDFWVFKINQEGNLIWQHCYGGAGNDRALNIIASPDKGYLVIGNSTSNDGDVSGHHGFTYLTDYWLIKIAEGGDLLWQKSLGGTSWDSGNDLELTDDGGIMVIGNAESTDYDITDHHNGYDYWLVKLQCLGNYFYADADADGYGDSDVAVEACFAPAGYIADALDCDDTNPLINPAISEACNAIDDNCNAIIDDGVLFTTYYADYDLDGFGDYSADSLSCSFPSGFVLNNTDCNDTDNAIFPDAEELCNGVDDNCNALTDDGIDFFVFYADSDADTYGDVLHDTLSCSLVEGYIADASDCDDTNNYIHPFAVELCNLMDDNCNGIIDDGVLYLTYYYDNDDDSFGDNMLDSTDCIIPEGFVLNNTDCNDEDNSINPGAIELCNHVDDNCNLLLDDGIITYTYYLDLDNDTYGNAAEDSTDCGPVAGYVEDNTDCDDLNAAIYPGAPEIINGLDDNCNQLIDEGVEEIIGSQLVLIKVMPNPGNGYFEIMVNEHLHDIKVITTNNIGEQIRKDVYDVIQNQNIPVDVSKEGSGIYYITMYHSNTKLGSAVYIKE